MGGNRGLVYYWVTVLYSCLSELKMIAKKNIGLLVMVFCSLLMWGFISHAQTLTLELGNASACQDEGVSIPISVSNFNNIGAITLFVEYDPSRLEFDTVSNLNILLASMVYNDIKDSTGQCSIGRFALSWNAFTSPVNFGNSDLINLDFIFKGPASDLIFDNACEVADYDANILTVSYSNATVDFIDTVEVYSQPDDIVVVDNVTVPYFSTWANNATSYLWQMRINGNWMDVVDNSVFNGSSTQMLQLFNPGPDLHGTYFRCFIEGCNSTYSDSVLLSVILSAPLVDGNQMDWGISMLDTKGILHVELDEAADVTLTQIGMDGRSFVIINRVEVCGEQSLDFYCQSSEKLCVFQLKINSDKGTIIQNKKIILQTY